MRQLLSILWITAASFALQGQVAYLDSSFNATGILSLNHTGAEDRPVLVLSRPNGKSLQIGYAYFFDHQTSTSTLTTVAVAQFDTDGHPDLNFGQNGVVVLDNLKTDANATDAVLMSDGKLLITGKYLNSTSGPHHFVARLKENGLMDNTFGVNGVTGYPDPNLVAWGSSVAVQPDGKIIMGGTKFTFIPPGSGYYGFAMVRFQSNGVIDSTFGNNGIVVRDYTGFDGVALAFGPDSSIYAGGGDNSSFLLHFKPNGIPDSTFGLAGILLINQVGGIRHIIVQEDGRIIIAGAKKSSSAKGFIRRLFPDGTYDPSFQDAGISNWTTLTGIATTPDGNIVAATAYGPYLRIFRYWADGQIDSSADQTIQIPEHYAFDNELSVLPNGKIMVGGAYTDEFLFKDYGIARFTATLQPDSSFGMNGFAKQNVSNNHSGGASILLDGQERILTGGSATYIDGTTIVNLPKVHNVGFVSRMLPDGSMDTTFASKGFTAMPYYPLTFNLIAQQADGKILAGGATNVRFDYSAIGVARILPNGSLDNTFGKFDDGVAQLEIDVPEVYATAVAPASDSTIIVLGKIVDAAGKRKIAIARFDQYGWPDLTFGTEGLVINESVPGNFQLNAGLIQPDGKILAGGTYLSPLQNIFLVRFMPDGTLDNSFGTGGIVLKPFGGTAYRMNGLALQPDGRIVLCGNQGGATTNTIVGRLNTDGLKDLTFSDDGVAVVNSGQVETGNALAITANGEIVIAGTNAISNAAENNNPFIIRLLPNGTIDSSFAGTGYVVTGIPGDNQLKAIAIQPDGSYITTGYSNDNYLLIRYLPKLSVGLLDAPGLQQEVLVYPNPIQGNTTFTYSLTEATRITLDLLDMQGKISHQFLVHEMRTAGKQSETLHFPANLSAGIYTLRIQAGNNSKAVQVVILR